MNELSLQDILRAEQDAENKVKAAAAEADRMRAEAAERVARLQKETDDRIEAARRDRMARLKAEIAETQTRAGADADAVMGDWRRRFAEKHEAIVRRIVDLITGQKEG